MVRSQGGRDGAERVRSLRGKREESREQREERWAPLEQRCAGDIGLLFLFYFASAVDSRDGSRNPRMGATCPRMGATCALRHDRPPAQSFARSLTYSLAREMREEKGSRPRKTTTARRREKREERREKSEERRERREERREKREDRRQKGRAECRRPEGRRAKNRSERFPSSRSVRALCRHPDVASPIGCWCPWHTS